MKNVFILNPAAGRKKAGSIQQDIIDKGNELNIDVKVVVTSGPEDFENQVAEIMKDRVDEEAVRFFACGGDGTLSEVINACHGYKNVEIGVLPYGTGNDFVRNFNKDYDFLDIKAQLLGETVSCNLIKYSGICDGKAVTKYCCNMFNIGFDCKVVDLAAKFKHYPFIAGSFAYIMGILVNLIEHTGTALRVIIDEKKVIEDSFLLCAIANGSFCGGGFKGAPKADVFDGTMDVSLIKKIGRLKFIKLIDKYAKGTFLELKEAKEIVDYNKCKKLRIEPVGHEKVSVDGEIVAFDYLDLEIIQDGFKLVLPKISL